jgi:hypothetical protein
MKNWIALLGRRDYPTDALEDYVSIFNSYECPGRKEDGFMPYIDSGRKQGLGRDDERLFDT